MYQHLTDWETHAENMQISVCFCKTCICLKNLENIQISANMINRLDITDEYSMKCDFILNTVTFIDAALNISLRKLWKCNVLWFYLFGQGVPNETKGTINLKYLSHKNMKCRYHLECKMYWRAVKQKSNQIIWNVQARFRKIKLR